MIKNKVNFKLINIALVILIITLLYLCGGLWSVIISKILEILSPFLVAFVIAYALHPFVNKLVKLKIPEKLSISIVLIVVLSIAFIFVNLSCVLNVVFAKLSTIFSMDLLLLSEESFNFTVL